MAAHKRTESLGPLLPPLDRVDPDPHRSGKSPEGEGSGYGVTGGISLGGRATGAALPEVGGPGGALITLRGIEPPCDPSDTSEETTDSASSRWEQTSLPGEKGGSPACLRLCILLL